jgi:hypothetical protein
MHLSEAEKRMVGQLRNREASLIRWRWVGAVSALLYIALGAFSLAAVLRVLRTPDPNAALLLSLLVPATFGMTAIGVGLAVYLFLRWNGRPEILLLLRLIEESEKHEN